MARTLKLAILDSHALIHRAYHALPPMNAPDGQPTNAVYGFTAMLFKVFTALKPTHVVAAFDMAGPTFREEEFKEYKAQRKPVDAELISQFELTRRLVRAFNIPILEKQSFEADDVIGTVTRLVDGGVRKIIVTGDADALQLVDATTTVFALKRGITDTVLYDEAVARERFGFPPAALPEYKGLRGDPSDNIPGVRGIGEKSAQSLIVQYGSIEEVYRHLDELPERLQAKLKGHKREALLSRRLAVIRRDVPLDFSLDKAALHDFDPAEVRKLFEELGFRSLLERLSVFVRAFAPGYGRHSKTAERIMPTNYHLVTGLKEQAVLRARLKKEKVIVFDTETDWLEARLAPMVGMSFAVKNNAWYVPADRESVKVWKELLEDKKVGKVGHNIKYDTKVLAQSGIQLRPIVFDSMVASYLLRPGVRQHNLDTLARQELEHETILITELIGPKPRGVQGRQKRMSEVPLPQLAHYAAEDADVTWRLYEKFSAQIKQEGLTRVLEEIELPLIEVLAAMELAGIRLDSAVLKKLQKKVEARTKKLQQLIWQQAGEEFNINSTQQLRKILFEKLGLSTVAVGRTQTGFSTAAAELTKLRQQHPIIGRLEEYRELTKLNNTYLTALPELVDAATGRLYTSFNQTVAATGRLSSSDPNLQNIPVRTELGEAVRAAFVAEPGHVLVKADYSQLELRLAAHIAQDENMIAAFRAGEDIHRATAAWVYGVAPAAVTSEQRRVAKTLNFGVLYGMGTNRFARESGLRPEEARTFIERYREQYSGIPRLFEATIQQAEDLGYVETLFGRKRYIPEIHSRTPALRAAAERAAFNFPMQGTEADILKKAMIVLHATLRQDFPEAALVLTVHDELVVEASMEAATAVAQAMRQAMEKVVVLDVPLTVDVAVGANWRDTLPV